MSLSEEEKIELIKEANEKLYRDVSEDAFIDDDLDVHLKGMFTQDELLKIVYALSELRNRLNGL